MADETGIVGGARQGEQAASGTPQRVPVNMYEAEHAVVVVAAMPGVMPDDIEVRRDGRTLTVRSSLRTPAPKDYLLHEWHYGPYHRELQLPEGFDGTTEARYANGQLAVRVERGEGGPSGAVTLHPE